MIFILNLVNHSEDVEFISIGCFFELSLDLFVLRTGEEEECVFFLLEDSVDCVLSEIDVLGVGEDDEENYQ